MKLIVGLGNPGREYERTPHNAGFEVVDILAARHGGPWQYERRFEAMACDATIGGRRLTLLKPLTYMNLSGRAVTAWMGKNGGEAGDILVVTDDINLAVGRLRLRADGSHGGHKGLLSIINSLGTTLFARLRVGVMPSRGTPDDVVAFVLGRLPMADRAKLEEAEEDAAAAVEMAVERDLDTAMNRFNRRAKGE